MSANRITYRYAKSIIDLARERDQLGEVYQDALQFTEVARENKVFARVMENPIVKTETKLQILNRIFEGKVTDITLKFIRLVVKKKRAAFLKLTFAEIINQYKDMKGIKKAVVKSAIPLTDSAMADIRKKLMAPGITEIELKNIVDESLIGGFVLKMEDKLLDQSISSKLKSLRKELSN